MPIKGISEVRRLPRLGKIRLGVREASPRTGGEFPRAVDHFVCRPDRSTSEAAARAFREVYGERPRELDIMFPVDDRDRFFEQWYRRYGSGTGLLCKGDGETALELDRETGEIREVECSPPACPWAAKKHCRPVGTLRFLLYRVPGLGVWQIDTSSYHSIVNLNSAIDLLRAVTGGRVAMIPLKLALRPREVQVEGRKKVIYVLELAGEGVRLEEVIRAARARCAPLLLPPADLDEAPDDLYPAGLISGAPGEGGAGAGGPQVAPAPGAHTEAAGTSPPEAAGEAAAGAPQTAPGESGARERARCASCGAEVTPGAAAYSVRRYGRPLCPGCQRGEKAGELAGTG